MRKVMVAGISYENSKWLRAHIEIIQQVKNELIDHGFKPSIHRVLWQPPINLDYKAKLAWYNLQEQIVGFKMFVQFYKETGQSSVRNLLKLFFGFQKQIFTNNPFNSVSLIFRARNLVLNDKHHSAWKSFLDSDSDFLLVIEDDGIPNISEFKSFISLINSNYSEYSENSHYFDLCSHYDIKTLFGISVIKNSITRGEYHLLPFFTSTTGAYLINRNFAAWCCDWSINNNSLTGISIDWKLNRMAQKLGDNKKIFFWATSQPAFENESLKQSSSSLTNLKQSEKE